MRADRGVLSIEIGAGLATVFVLGVYYLLMSEFWDPLHAEASTQVTNSTAQEPITWMGIAWEWYLAIALGVVVIGVIVRAQFERQGGRL